MQGLLSDIRNRSIAVLLDEDAAYAGVRGAYMLAIGINILAISVSVTLACAKRTGAAASVECRRREPAMANSPRALQRQSVSHMHAHCLVILICGILIASVHVIF